MDAEIKRLKDILSGLNGCMVEGDTLSYRFLICEQCWKEYEEDDDYSYVCDNCGMFVCDDCSVLLDGENLCDDCVIVKSQR